MTVRVGASTSGGSVVAAGLRSRSGEVRRLLPLVVGKAASDLVALTQRNASGRPGPNAPTGDYRGSWRVDDHGRQTPTRQSRVVGTDRPQANRLEYGFVGFDSLGRFYDQQPYPHHGPAVDVIRPNFEAAMDALAAKVAR